MNREQNENLYCAANVTLTYCKALAYILFGISAVAIAVHIAG